jgi:hypothetical protein
VRYLACSAVLGRDVVFWKKLSATWGLVCGGVVQLVQFVKHEKLLRQLRLVRKAYSDIHWSSQRYIITPQERPTKFLHKLHNFSNSITTITNKNIKQNIYNKYNTLPYLVPNHTYTKTTKSVSDLWVYLLHNMQSSFSQRVVT